MVEPAGTPDVAPKIILSASRRTDIPGGYTPWFMDCIQRGFFTVTNPFNRKTRTIEATPDTVHTIVFWSKNLGPFLDLGAHKTLTEKGFNLFFNFTLNADTPALEPGIPDLATRLKQAAKLARDLDPSQIAWRFDPICFYEQENRPMTNAIGFERIADALSGIGISRCITSFYDPYKKVDQRIRRLVLAGNPRIEFTRPDTRTRKNQIQLMAGYLKSKSMNLFLCCERGLLESMGSVENVRASACIDGRLYQSLFGGSAQTAKDVGQRHKQGCRCTRSIDVGDYDRHPCPHNCLFCYARTQFDSEKKAENYEN